jgi:hypothetical protein
VTLKVETGTLRSVAFDLGSVATVLSDISGRVRAVTGLADPNAKAGLDALTLAWGVALQVLAEDARFLSGQVANAATTYDTTDGALAAGVRQ